MSISISTSIRIRISISIEITILRDLTSKAIKVDDALYKRNINKKRENYLRNGLSRNASIFEPGGASGHFLILLQKSLSVIRRRLCKDK